MEAERDDDDSFLGYCDLHSETERHLFHVNDVRRLHQLAGVPVPEGQLGMRTFIGMDRYYARPLIERARRRARLQVIQGGK